MELPLSDPKQSKIGALVKENMLPTSIFLNYEMVDAVLLLIYYSIIQLLYLDKHGQCDNKCILKFLYVQGNVVEAMPLKTTCELYFQIHTYYFLNLLLFNMLRRLVDLTTNCGVFTC